LRRRGAIGQMLRQHDGGIASAAARHQGAERLGPIPFAGEQIVIDFQQVAGRARDQPLGFVLRIARGIRQGFVVLSHRRVCLIFLVACHSCRAARWWRNSSESLRLAGMKGYFGIGVERISKAANVGTLFRTAHAFGASFIFTVASQYRKSDLRASDTADTPRSLPLYEFADVKSVRLPKECRLVGIEITPDAVELPSFHHPRQAAYVLGSEREGLSAELLEQCDHVIR